VHIACIKSQSDSAGFAVRAWTTTVYRRTMTCRDIPVPCAIIQYNIQRYVMFERKTQFSRISVDAWRQSGARASFAMLPNQVIDALARMTNRRAPLCHYLTTDLNDPTMPCFIFQPLCTWYNIISHQHPHRHGLYRGYKIRTMIMINNNNKIFRPTNNRVSRRAADSGLCIFNNLMTAL